MPRGGSRPGSGRKANPNSARQQKLAKRAARADAAAPERAEGRGFTLPSGQKSPAAPPGWPFGTSPPPVPAAPPGADGGDPDEDDGLTDEERSGLTPLQYLLAVMRSERASKSLRMTAAIQAAPYVHPKIAPKGKKEGALDDAKNKPSRFAPAAAPRLAAAHGKKV